MAETEITFQAVESPEGGYEAWALGHNIVTEADDWKQLQRHLREAVQCHFPAAELPRLINLHFVRDEVIEVGVEGDRVEESRACFR